MDSVDLVSISRIAAELRFYYPMNSAKSRSSHPLFHHFSLLRGSMPDQGTNGDDNFAYCEAALATIAATSKRRSRR